MSNMSNFARYYICRYYQIMHAAIIMQQQSVILAVLTRPSVWQPRFPLLSETVYCTSGNFENKTNPHIMKKSQREYVKSKNSFLNVLLHFSLFAWQQYTRHSNHPVKQSEITQAQQAACINSCILQMLLKDWQSRQTSENFYWRRLPIPRNCGPRNW